MSSTSPHWTREQVLIALNLYCQLPFGKLDERTPVVIKVAKLLGRTPGALSMKLNNLASLDPAITGTGRVGLIKRSALDESIWAEFRNDPEGVAEQSQMLMDELVKGTDLVDLSSASDLEGTYSSTEAETTTTATVKVRRGQHFFRRAVLASYGGSCCMSGLQVQKLLVASHIRPWNLDAKNRLNPQNGLCLSALHDRAFDLGFLSVRPDYTVAVSPEITADLSGLATHALTALEGYPIQLPAKFQPSTEFLEWHYSTLFRS